MHKIDGSGNVDGTFVHENPALNQPGTLVTEDWLNAVQSELVNVIEAADIPLNKAANNQVLLALRKLFAASENIALENAVFEGSVTDGEAVYFDAVNNRFDEAIADGTVKQNMIGFADVTNHKVYTFGKTALFLGLTVGAKYYLSTSVPGEITAIKPIEKAVVVGVAQTATVLIVDIDDSSESGVQVGAIQYYARNTAPPGTIKANGAGVLVASYAALTASIYCGDAQNPTALFGFRANNADGSGRNIAGAYLILPDIRGEFIRGWDDGRGVDSGRAFGSAQTDDFAAHSHTTNVTVTGNTGTSSGTPKWSGFSNSIGSASAASNSVGGTETRPHNIALLACIKY